MSHHLRGHEITQARGKSGVGVSRPEKDRYKFLGSQIRPGQFQQHLPVLPAPLQPLRGQKDVPVQGNLRIDGPGEEDGEAFRHDFIEEGVSGRKKFFQE